MKRWACIQALLAAACTLAVVGTAMGENFTAVGTWSAGKSSGTWQAQLNRDGEVVSGRIQLTGASAAAADVAGTLRGDRIEFGVVGTQREVASFDGVITMGKVGGTLKMGAESGTWAGMWDTAPATFVPVTNGRPGTLAAPFDTPQVAAAVPTGDPCDLLSNGKVSYMSGGGETALRTACAMRAGSATSAAGTGPLAATSVPSCHPGLPESNPPTPPTVAGNLANNVSRPLQNWPRITQSETTGLVGVVDSQHQATYYNDTQFEKEQCSFIGHAHLSSSNGWTENPGEPVLPLLGSGIVPASDPSGASDRADVFRTAYLAINANRQDLPPVIAISRSNNYGFSHIQPQEVIYQPGRTPDKEWFATDWTSNAAQNRQYLCWMTDNGGIIWFARQLVGAMSWDPPIQLRSVSAAGVVQGCQVAVAPDSSVYVVWWEEVNGVSAILGRRSTDGATFGTVFNASGNFTKPSDAIATADCGTPALKGHVRMLPLPSIDIDRTNGTVAVAFTRRPASGSGSEIAFVRSTNQGGVWSTPLVINDSSVGDKFMPALASNPYNQHLKIMWYDRRNDANNVSIDVYAATSTDGGASFGQNARITNGLFGVPHIYPNFDCDQTTGCGLSIASCYMGDYNQLVGFGNQAGFLHTWGDNSLKFFDPDDNLNVPDPDIRTMAGC